MQSAHDQAVSVETLVNVLPSGRVRQSTETNQTPERGTLSPKVKRSATPIYHSRGLRIGKFH